MKTIRRTIVKIKDYTQDQFILNYTINQNPTDTKTLPSHLEWFNAWYGQMKKRIVIIALWVSPCDH